MTLPRFCTLILAVSSLLLNISAWAGDAAAGKELYGACAACHGVGGEGNAALNGPALNGQTEAYIGRQLTHFKSGVRAGDSRDTLGVQMAAMASTLVDEAAIANVAAYIASLPPTFVSTKAEGDLRSGNNYYQGNCGACHGGKAEGNALLNAPRLAGLDTDYMIRQYKNFSQGIRGAHPDDKWGKQMKFMANSLPNEAALQDVVAFIHTQAAK